MWDLSGAQALSISLDVKDPVQGHTLWEGRGKGFFMQNGIFGRQAGRKEL